MYVKYRPDKLFFWNRPRCSFWAAPGGQRAQPSCEGRSGAASSLPSHPSWHGGLQALPGDTEAVPQVQEAMSPLLRLQARSGTKHPRICSPLAAAVLSHRELCYQHRPETDPPTAAGSQAGKALWGQAPCAGDPPQPPRPGPALGHQIKVSYGLCAASPEPQHPGSTGWGAPAPGPALQCLPCPPPALPRSARLCRERGQGGLQLSRPLLPARSLGLGFHLGPGFAGC